MVKQDRNLAMMPASYQLPVIAYVALALGYCHPGARRYQTSHLTSLLPLLPWQGNLGRLIPT